VKSDLGSRERIAMCCWPRLANRLDFECRRTGMDELRFFVQLFGRDELVSSTPGKAKE